jgi:hypothetical protein
MTYQQLREKAKQHFLNVKTNGDYDSTGRARLWAMYCNISGERQSPFFTLAEWQNKDIQITCLDYIRERTIKQLGVN